MTEKSAPAGSQTWSAEVAQGQRFQFGRNWARFLKRLDEKRIVAAEASLVKMLGGSPAGRSFLDIGSGSGLFSLAARRLGARVHSLDFDPDSVACTAELKRRYFADDGDWVVEQASVLDDGHMAALGTFDLVYSWGVLHHTGEMWHALANAADRVAPGGTLFIAIYNDQGRPSRRWSAIKRAYVRAPGPLKWLVLAPSFARLWGPTLVRDTLRGRPTASWQSYERDSTRGMDPWRDVVDWVGGYPFEVATPDEMLDFHRARGFTLTRMTTVAGGLGCNEFVFTRD